MTKEDQIEAAWAEHNNPTPNHAGLRLMQEKQEKRIASYKSKAPKVIFANREEINECFKAYLQRKVEARKAKEQEKVVKALPVLADRKYHNLGDLKMLARAA